MKIVPPLLAAAAFVAIAVPAFAVFDTETYAALRAELETRRDNDFGGELDKDAKKQQKAVAQSLKFLDKKSKGRADDLKWTARIAKALAKAYPEDFATTDGGEPLDLSDLVDQIIMNQAGAVDADIGELEGRVTSLTGSLGRRAVKASEKARIALGDAGQLDIADMKKRATLLRRAEKQLVKGEKLAAKAEAKAAGKTKRDALVATVDGTPFESNFAQAEVYSGDDALELFANGPFREERFGVGVVLTVSGVDGPGTYTSQTSQIQGNFQSGFPAVEAPVDPASVTFEVLTFNPPNRIVVRFSADFIHPTNGTISFRNATHDVESEIATRQGNGIGGQD